MLRHRKIIVISLLACGVSVLAFTAISWLATARPSFDPDGSLTENLLVLFLCSAAVCLSLISVFYLALRLAITAARHGHSKPLELFARFAPTLTRRLMGSLIGTSLVLSGTTVLAQADTLPVAPAASTHHDESVAFPAAHLALNNPARTSVPTPGWMPGSINIELNRLMGSPKERQQSTSAVEHVIVTSGQTLWSIAEQMLDGSGSSTEISHLWPQIYEMNREVIGQDPNMLQLGIELKLPKIN